MKTGRHCIHLLRSHRPVALGRLRIKCQTLNFSRFLLFIDGARVCANKSSKNQASTVSVKCFCKVTRSYGRNKEAQFRNNQINLLCCCLISADCWMAAGVYHRKQSHPFHARARDPHPFNQTHYYQSQDFTPE